MDTTKSTLTAIVVWKIVRSIPLRVLSTPSPPEPPKAAPMEASVCCRSIKIMSITASPI